MDHILLVTSISYESCFLFLLNSLIWRIMHKVTSTLNFKILYFVALGLYPLLIYSMSQHGEITRSSFAQHGEITKSTVTEYDEIY